MAKLSVRNATQLAIGLSLMLAIYAGIAPAGANADVGAAAAPLTVTIGAGATIPPTPDGPQGTWQVMQFFPMTLTVGAGDTVRWTSSVEEPHTVTFTKPGEPMPALIIPEGGGSTRLMLNPDLVFAQGGTVYTGTTLVGSGQLDQGPQSSNEFTVTFPSPGTYIYACGFHNMMTGTVTVLPVGSIGIDTQLTVVQRVFQQSAKALQALAQATTDSVQHGSVPVAGPDDKQTYPAQVGWGDGSLAMIGFSPAQTTIGVGDTVEWVQDDAETPHTVTFPGDAAAPAFVLVEGQPPQTKLIVNQAALAPAGGSVYSGIGLANSGLMPGTDSPQPGPRSYALTFDKPGIYHYLCLIHGNIGMVGSVTVLTQFYLPLVRQ